MGECLDDVPMVCWRDDSCVFFFIGWHIIIFVVRVVNNMRGVERSRVDELL